jgi:hypothetical protein
MVETEICRYRDASLDERVEAAEAEADERIGEINDTVQQDHAEEISDLQDECDRMKTVLEAIEAIKTEMQEEMQEAADEIFERYRPRLDELLPDLETDFADRAEGVLQNMRDGLDAATPDSVDDLADWPEPEADDPHDDPLYDSSRTYMDQIERYRRHQGKDGADTTVWTSRRLTRTCEICGETFETASARANVCSKKCKMARWRRWNKEHPGHLRKRSNGEG